MKRALYNSLLKWKESPRRKPLILEGARQVGKTWLLQEFGRNEYCSEQEFAKTLFQDDLVPNRILRDIVANTGQRITPGRTLIFFDEIQDAPKGITSLKYFCEDAPEQHVVVAGSLLGVVHHPGESYPVGKVNMLRLYPMTFEEFIWAKGNAMLEKMIKDCKWDSFTAVDHCLKDLLRQYFYVGGMPEAVLEWVTTEDVLNVREIQNRILSSYTNDISKHAGNYTERVRMVWNTIPAQLAKENKKFVYGAVRKGGRAKDFEVAIQWLVDAGLTYKIHRCNSPEQPLKFYEDFDAFKLYLLDVGLLGALAEVSAGKMLVNNDVFKEYKGAFTENYVLEQLIATENFVIYYFSKENSKVEVDFLVQTNKRVIQFVRIDHANKNLKGLRCSMKPYIDQGWMENIPLYSVKAYIDKENEVQI